MYIELDDSYFCQMDDTLITRSIKYVIILTKFFFFFENCEIFIENSALWIFRQIYDITDILKENPCSVSTESNKPCINILLSSYEKKPKPSFCSECQWESCNNAVCTFDNFVSFLYFIIPVPLYRSWIDSLLGSVRQ